MAPRAALRWLSAIFLLIGALSLEWRFLGEQWVSATTPLTMLVLGFSGVLALFLKD